MDPGAAELSVYTGLNEKQLKRFYEPYEGLFICESGKVIRRALQAGYEAESFFAEEDKLGEVEELAGRCTPVYAAPHSVMKNITGYELTGGILAAMKRKPLKDPETILGSCRRLVILDDIENPTNVGAIFRSAAALGADAVLLTKGCADPLYRRAARVSMGSVFQADWTYIAPGFLKNIKDAGFTIFALALSDDAATLDGIGNTGGKKAVVLGNEDHGISKDIIELCDMSVIIPMKHDIDSLNVAAASAVAFWELFK